MRVAGLLVGAGRFEGTTVVPPAWVARIRLPVSVDGHHGFGLELAGAAQGLEPFVLDDALFLRGPARWRLFMLPNEHLAILFGAQGPPAVAHAPNNADASQAWDETRIANLVLRALRDPPAPADPASLLQRLVPRH
jgi:hypothetical protein